MARRPEHPITPLNFIDKVTVLCAGSPARYIIERNRTRQYFQTLQHIPLTPQKSTAEWAEEIGGNITGERPARRSFVAPWKGALDIIFRYRVKAPEIPPQSSYESPIYVGISEPQMTRGKSSSKSHSPRSSPQVPEQKLSHENAGAPLSNRDPRHLSEQKKSSMRSPNTPPANQHPPNCPSTPTTPKTETSQMIPHYSATLKHKTCFAEAALPANIIRQNKRGTFDLERACAQLREADKAAKVKVLVPDTAQKPPKAHSTSRSNQNSRSDHHGGDETQNILKSENTHKAVRFVVNDHSAGTNSAPGNYPILVGDNGSALCDNFVLERDLIEDYLTGDRVYSDSSQDISTKRSATYLNKGSACTVSTNEVDNSSLFADSATSGKDPVESANTSFPTSTIDFRTSSILKRFKLGINLRSWRNFPELTGRRDRDIDIQYRALPSQKIHPREAADPQRGDRRQASDCHQPPVGRQPTEHYQPEDRSKVAGVSHTTQDQPAAKKCRTESKPKRKNRWSLHILPRQNTRSTNRKSPTAAQKESKNTKIPGTWPDGEEVPVVSEGDVFQQESHKTSEQSSKGRGKMVEIENNEFLERGAQEQRSKGKGKAVQVEDEDEVVANGTLKAESCEASEQHSKGREKAVQIGDDDDDEVEAKFEDDEALEMKPRTRFKRTGTVLRVQAHMRRGKSHAEGIAKRQPQQTFYNRNIGTRGVPLQEPDERPVPKTTMVDTTLDTMRFSARQAPEPLKIATGGGYEFW